MEVFEEKSRTVLRALALVDAVGASRGPARPQTLATEVHLTLPTTLRLLKTLVSAGYLDKLGRGYSLGPRISQLYNSYEVGLRPPSRYLGALQRIAELTQETAFLSDWHANDARVCAVVEGVKAVRVNGMHVGMHGYAYARASGKVLLAFGSWARRDEYLDGREFEVRTPRTITTGDAFKLELQKVVLSGYATDQEELIPGVSCVSIPLEVTSEGSGMALTVTVPAHQFADELLRILESLRDVVKNLYEDQPNPEAFFGHREPYQPQSRIR